MIDTFISLTGLVYTIGKDAKLYMQERVKKIKSAEEYTSREKIVKLNYPSETGLQDNWEKKGYKVAWVLPKNIDSKTDEGFEVIYEINDQKKEITSLRCWNEDGKNNLLLMGIKKSSS